MTPLNGGIISHTGAGGIGVASGIVIAITDSGRRKSIGIRMTRRERMKENRRPAGLQPLETMLKGRTAQRCPSAPAASQMRSPPATPSVLGDYGHEQS